MSGYDDLTVMGTAPKVMGTAPEVKPTTAALAAALHKTGIPDEIVDGDHWADSEWCIDIENEWAAAILAALDGAGWRLTARDKMCHHETEVATLRAALDGLVEAATTFLANYDAVAESDDPMAAGAHEEGWWIVGAAALDDALDEAGR